MKFKFAGRQGRQSESSVSDEALMRAYADAQDMQAFECLYYRHKGALYRYLLRQVAGPDTAKDLYQEVWSRIIRSASSYVPSAKWTTWAYRIAHNLVADHYRTLKPVADEEVEVTVDRDSPQRLHESRQMGVQLEHCLDKLPAVQREVFVLSQETDLTMAMVARVVDASHEACKTRLRYARSALIACLEKIGFGPNGLGPKGADSERGVQA